MVAGIWLANSQRHSKNKIPTSKQTQDCSPRLAQVHNSCKDQNAQSRVACVDTCDWKSVSHKPDSIRSQHLARTVIEELSQRSALSCPPSKGNLSIFLQSCRKAHLRLHAIHRIKSLVQEQSDGAARIHPRRTIRIQVGIVPHHRDEIDHHEHESTQGNLPQDQYCFFVGALFSAHCPRAALYCIEAKPNVEVGGGIGNLRH